MSSPNPSHRVEVPLPPQKVIFKIVSEDAISNISESWELFYRSIFVHRKIHSHEPFLKTLTYMYM